ncbi:hypothetical protein [Amantichitinum ursilacus]|uniref:Uncharacterized protein n=1 Tax=Amantichitinum ursilacus TaxID=857265 RepID=A0A0N0XN14_9NEIS|nr:hypothetical protein [Amantichitinum ursilacus]KPC55273.1 hypothetical protein WG78_01405 [Amantichitinum ursilacus]
MLCTRLFASLFTAAVLAASPLLSQAATDASTTIGSGFALSTAGVLVSTEGKPFEGSIGAPVGSAAGVALVVVGVVMVASDTAEISVTKTADGSKAVIRLSAQALRKAGVVAGSVVQGVSEATGYSLIASGQLLAFIPNQTGQSLLQHSRISAAASAPASN